MNYRYLLTAMHITRSFPECGLAVLALVIAFHCTFTHKAVGVQHLCRNMSLSN